MSDFLTRIAKLSPARLALLANELNERLQMLEGERSAPIAIIGMGCRYPGHADDPESFWTILHEGVDAIEEVPADRWDVNAYYHPDPDHPGTMATRWGGFVEAPDRFDPKFFGIAPAEAITMDPQQRLLLETTWEALENAGIAPATLAGTPTGVFVGICNSDYAFHSLRAGHERITPYFASGLSHAVASGRISYLLGLEGPSATIDTSCSASLMAVHLACQSLRRRESALALAGGANVILSPETTIALSHSRMMAPDGRCKPFSDDANGFVRSEGSGIVVLKRLSEAIADRNRILAVIRGTAANQDGKSSGLTAPNGPSQEAVLRAALSDAGMSADHLQYIEAHGTGTALGDPIEVGALAQVFAERSPEAGPLWIGSVKSNMGHLESAAGIAGLMKLVLALQHRKIPATLHSGRLNHRIQWESLPLRVASRRESWPKVNGLRAGGVSSFGFSGTNVHVIVEEGPPVEAETAEQSSRRPALLLLSARTETAVQHMATRLADWLGTSPGVSLRAMEHTLMAGRAHFEQRLAFVADSCRDVITNLRNLSGPDVRRARAIEHEPPIGFIFAADDVRADFVQVLRENTPAFHETLQRYEAILAGESTGSVRLSFEEWCNGAVPAETRVAFQVAVQLACAELLQSCAVQPAAVWGSGAGVIAAACCAGILRPEDGLRLALTAGHDDAQAALARTIPVNVPRMPLFVAGEKGLSIPWIEHARGMGTILPASEAHRENCRAWVVIGDEATQTGLPQHCVSLSGQHAKGMKSILHVAAELYTLGCKPDVSRLDGTRPPRPIALPTYPFERERYWLELQPESAPRGSTKIEAPSGQSDAAAPPAPADWLYELAWEPLKAHPGQQFLSLAPTLRAHGAEPGSEAVLRVGEASARVQQICGGYAWRSFQRLGLRATPGESFTLDELCQQLEIAPERRRIADRLLGILVEDGVITRTDNGFGFAKAFPTSDPDADLAALDEQYPEIRTELKILKRCAEQTPAVLRGTCDPMQLFFTAGSIDEAEQIYEKSPVCRYFNHEAQEIIREAVAHIHGRPARILEIGAGTGATTASVLPALVGCDVVYCFTDLSPVFLKRAREKFRDYSGVEYKLLNVERDPAEQGFEAGSYDIVLAANVLHATANLRETVAHARQLLRPGGMLMLIEGSHPDRWLDLTLGLTDGWFRFADFNLRQEHPLITPATWQQLFREQGLDYGRSIQYTERNGDLSQQVLLAACETASVADASVGAAHRRHWMIFADRGGVGAALEKYLRGRSESCEIVAAESALEFVAKSRAEDELQVVYLRGLDLLSAEEAIDWCAQLPVRLIQQLSGVQHKAKLWLVTSGAQAVQGSAPSEESALQAMMWGIGRVLSLEQPNLLGRLIDLDPKASREASAAQLFAEMISPDPEDQIAFRGPQRLAPRLRRSAAAELSASSQPLPMDGSWLITGAFGGVGREVTRWLAASGAGHLVLISRTGAGSGASPAAEERSKLLRELESMRVPVTVISGDVSSAETVERAFSLFGAECPPLRGIVHLANSQKMADLSRVTGGEVAEVLAPKVLGTLHLARAARSHRPDYFVSFSSVAALLGAQGMAAYAAANQFLDSFAAAERARGLPMIAVNWGAWMTSDASAQLERLGLVLMPLRNALAWMSQLLSASRTGAMIADMDWKTFRALYEARRVRPVLSELREPDPTRGGSRDFTRVHTIPPAMREKSQGSSIAEVVLAESARVLGFRAGDQPPVDVPLTDLGLDSLMAVDLRNRLQTVIGRELPSTIVFDYPTVSKLTSVMETMLWAAAANPSPDERTEQDEVRI